MHQKSLPLICAGVLLLFLLVLSSSCATHQINEPPTYHYTLDYEPPVFPDMPALATTLRVTPFESAPEFDTDRIIYKTGKYTLASYHYRAWMAKPSDQVQYFLERDLQRSGLLLAVLSDSSRFRPAYLLSGSVEKFLEVDEGDHWDAELALDIILQRMPQAKGMAKVLGQRHYSMRKTCAAKKPRAVAEAMSLAMAELSKQIQQDLYGLIKNDLAERPEGE